MKLAWKQALAALVVGGAVGVAAAPGIAERQWRSGRSQQRMLSRFSSKLHLSGEQHSQVAAILETKRQKIDALRAEVKPRFQEIRTATSAEIRQLLTPEQQRTFDVIETQHNTRMERLRARRAHRRD